MMDHARTRHAHGDNGSRFPAAVNRPRPERHGLDTLCEANKRRASKTALVTCALGSVLDDPADMGQDVHIDGGARRRGIHWRTKPLRGRERFRYRVEKSLFGL